MQSRTSQISSLAGLLRSTRQHGWEPRLEPRVDVFHEDYPRQMSGAPRALPEAVMAQLEREDILARFPDPRGRLLARILMGTGLRIGDASNLRVDCIVRDGQGAPCLHYTNHKMAREAFVPIDTDLADAIVSQQQAVLAVFAEPEYLLPRPTRNPDGLSCRRCGLGAVWYGAVGAPTFPWVRGPDGFARLGRASGRDRSMTCPFACQEDAQRLTGQGWPKAIAKRRAAPLTREGCGRSRRGPDRWSRRSPHLRIRNFRTLHTTPGSRKSRVS